jgi:hypothetical protein
VLRADANADTMVEWPKSKINAAIGEATGRNLSSYVTGAPSSSSPGKHRPRSTNARPDFAK